MRLWQGSPALSREAAWKPVRQQRALPWIRWWTGSQPCLAPSSPSVKWVGWRIRGRRSKDHIHLDFIIGAKSLQSCPALFSSLWTATRQALLSLGFSRQGYWSGWPCPPPGDLSDPGMEPASLVSTALTVGGSFPLAPPGKLIEGEGPEFPHI